MPRAGLRYAHTRDPSKPVELRKGRVSEFTRPLLGSSAFESKAAYADNRWSEPGRPTLTIAEPCGRVDPRRLVGSLYRKGEAGILHLEEVGNYACAGVPLQCRERYMDEQPCCRLFAEGILNRIPFARRADPSETRTFPSDTGPGKFTGEKGRTLIQQQGQHRLSLSLRLHFRS